MVWRRVQVERPRVSTSGGQFSGVVSVVVDVGVEEVREGGCEEVLGFLLFACCLVMAAQAETEVQERQLEMLFC